jgi:hypothetical protein
MLMNSSWHKMLWPAAPSKPLTQRVGPSVLGRRTLWNSSGPAESASALTVSAPRTCRAVRAPCADRLARQPRVPKDRLLTTRTSCYNRNIQTTPVGTSPRLLSKQQHSKGNLMGVTVTMPVACRMPCLSSCRQIRMWARRYVPSVNSATPSTWRPSTITCERSTTPRSL